METVEITGEFLSCPHCGARLFSWAYGVIGRCPHLVFAAAWSDTENTALLYAHEDYARRITAKLRSLATTADGDEEAVTPPPADMEVRFITGDYEPGDDVSTGFAAAGTFEDELCPAGTVAYVQNARHSRVRVAIAPSDLTA